MAINWEYPPELVAAVIDAWEEFVEKYEAACDDYQTEIAGVSFALSAAQQDTLQSMVVALWNDFEDAVDALKDHATGA